MYGFMSIYISRHVISGKWATCAQTTGHFVSNVSQEKHWHALYLSIINEEKKNDEETKKTNISKLSTTTTTITHLKRIATPSSSAATSKNGNVLFVYGRRKTDKIFFFNSYSCSNNYYEHYFSFFLSLSRSPLQFLFDLRSLSIECLTHTYEKY